MKYGLIVHFKTRNIGDDIQCYVMEKFLPRVDYLIDREHLDSFYTSTGEQVAAFLGGWYLQSPLNWPPSPFLKLFPTSIHFTNKGGKVMFILKDYGATWLKQIAPIGCRDEGTAELLKSFGIKAYVSGCFTLAIEPFADVEKHEKIVLVDCSKEVFDFVKANTKKKIVVASHRYAIDKLSPEVVAFAEEHDAKDVIATSHEPAQPDEPHELVYHKGSWSYRRALMEGLLRFYQGASLVVTKRLHVALPCLAMGTPVLMINGEDKSMHYKFSTYTPYVNHTTQKDLLSKKYSFDFDNPAPNPGGHEKFSEKIKRACKEFITYCENYSDEPKIDLELWRDYYRRVLRLKRIMQTLLPSAYLPNLNLLNQEV